MTKQLNTRIQNKYDFEVNWNKATFTPKKGEMIIYASEVDTEGNTLPEALDATTGLLPDGREEPYNYARVKFGDGNTPVEDLPFVTGDSNVSVQRIETFPTQDGTLIYNGSQQHPSWLNYDDTKMYISGTTSGVNAGTYTTYFTPFPGYCWSTGGSEPFTTTWTIQKADGSVSVDTQLVRIPAISRKTSVVVDATSNIVAESSDDSIVTVSVENNVLFLIKEGEGTATITITAESSNNYTEATAQITVDSEYTLDSLTWEEISQISREGFAHNYFAVGDTKTIHFEGSVTTYDSTVYASYNNDIDVFILGIDHNAELEGPGIHFCGFNAPLAMGNSFAYSGFTMCGPRFQRDVWKDSFMRCKILGSTDSITEHPSQSKGLDPTESCATSPVDNTVMSCLPEDLRNVMKPLRKTTYSSIRYTDDSEDNLANSIDYLPLLSVTEVFGKVSSSYDYNSLEEILQTQKQYDYFKFSNSLKLEDSIAGSSDTYREASIHLRSGLTPSISNSDYPWYEMFRSTTVGSPYENIGYCDSYDNGNIIFIFKV